MAQIGATEGTYYYWAPEMMQAPEDGRAHFNAFACDVWALGVCYYNFRTRENPFTSEAVDDLFEAISEGAVDLERDELSGDERRLLRGLLAVDPAERVTVGDLLEDPYLVRYPVHHSATAFSAKSTPRAHLSRRGSQRGTFAGRCSGSGASAGYQRAGSRGDGDAMDASARPSPPAPGRALPPAAGPSPPASNRASPEPLRDVWSSDDGEPGAPRDDNSSGRRRRVDWANVLATEDVDPTPAAPPPSLETTVDGSSARGRNVFAPALDEVVASLDSPEPAVTEEPALGA